MRQEKGYASFSSLIWEHVYNKRGEVRAHFWQWKGYQVVGVGVSETGVGGVWYARGIGCRKPFKSCEAAQAAVEVYELQHNIPVIPVDEVEELCELLDEKVQRTFDELLELSELDAGRLSDLLARGFEVGMIRIWFGVGYSLETRRR